MPEPGPLVLPVCQYFVSQWRFVSRQHLFRAGFLFRAAVSFAKTSVPGLCFSIISGRLLFRGGIFVSRHFCFVAAFKDCSAQHPISPDSLPAQLYLHLFHYFFPLRSSKIFTSIGKPYN